MHNLAFAPHLKGFGVQLIRATGEQMELRVIATRPRAV